MAVLATLLDSMVPNENNLPDGAPAKVLNISVIHQAVGDRKQNLLFLHAITGCDTVCAV